MAKKDKNQASQDQETINDHPGNEDSAKQPPAADQSLRISELEKEVSVLNDQLKSTRDQLLRSVAEFDNYRRRSETEKQDLIKFGGEALIKDLLPFLDDLERSLNVPQADPVVFRDGVRLIYSNLVKALDQRGVKPLETVGKKFNVDEHDALLHIEKEGAEPDTVTEEVQKGYTYNGKVIRHAKVLVAK
ncbi:MAG: nucleotide exchange factor GrpE [Bacteroidetes bacterium]|nr:nucleotide exchange factor GrpE [Bacteroidota bacterium]